VNDVVLPGRPTAYSRIALSRIMTALDVNLYGTVHGGVIMKFIDDAAGAVAARHCGFNAVTVAIDEIELLVPVRVGDLTYAKAQVNWTGTTSLEIGVVVLADGESDDPPRAHVQHRVQLELALISVHLGAVGVPLVVDPVRLEVPFDQVRGPPSALVLPGGAASVPLRAGHQVLLTHDRRHGVHADLPARLT